MEILMKAVIPAKFGMECCRKDFSFLDQNDFLAVPGEDFNIGGRFFNYRRADERGVEIFDVEGWNLNVRVEAFDLATVGVSFNSDVEEAQVRRNNAALDIFGQNNGSRAGSKDRHAGSRAFDDLFIQSRLFKKKADGRTFTAGNNQCIAFF